MNTKQKFTRNERRLFWFGIFMTGFGWGAAGYQLRGIGLAIGFGLVAALVVFFCMFELDHRPNG